MIRNLKALLLAALTVTALAALGASAAQAHTPATFTNVNGGATTLTVEKDGTGKTAHQVFDIFNEAKTASVSFTCNEVTGDGHFHGGTATQPADATITTPLFTGECSVAGQKLVTVNPGQCNLTFFPDGTVEIVDHVGNTECVHGKKPILVTTGAFNCTVEVGTQKVTGLVNYHNLKAGVTVGDNNEGETITVEAKELTLTYNSFGTGCPFGTTANGLYTTGNAIVKGEVGGVEVPIRWDTTKA